MNKPTPGKWRKGERVPERHAIRILAEDGSLVAEARGAGGPWAEVEGNANVIIAAHNACFAINPSNPLAVAEALEEAMHALWWLVDEYRTHNFVLLNAGKEAEIPTNGMLAALDALAKLEKNG